MGTLANKDQPSIGINLPVRFSNGAHTSGLQLQRTKYTDEQIFLSFRRGRKREGVKMHKEKGEVNREVHIAVPTRVISLFSFVVRLVHRLSITKYCLPITDFHPVLLPKRSVQNFVDWVIADKFIERVTGDMSKTKTTTVAQYIKATPKEAQEKLQELRSILRKVVPKAKETLKWGSPVFEEKRILFAYSAFKTHLNFMPTRSALQPFEEELAAYTTGKDTIQFPYDKPLPKALIRKIAAFRARDVRDNDARWM